MQIQTKARCSECDRTFDLLDEDEAAEWNYGHDCEPPATSTYMVQWNMNYEAFSPQDALRQALGDLAVVASDEPRGPTGFWIAPDGGDGVMLDAEFTHLD